MQIRKNYFHTALRLSHYTLDEENQLNLKTIVSRLHESLILREENDGLEVERAMLI